MRNLFSDHDRLSIDDERSVSRPIPQPLAIDPWVASSLLQKANRRGDADLAERAAVTLHRVRGKGQDSSDGRESRQRASVAYYSALK
jgi:hypothetical protein